MGPFFNPGGHNWGSENLDGYGITQIAIAVVYTIGFFAAVVYLWSKRNHPAVRFRKVGLALLAILILHVYLFMIFMVYPLNGKFPCGVEYWIMSTYLPIGIGLFSAGNQQLLLVSRQQEQLTRVEESFKPMFPYDRNGLICPRYWSWKFRVWWQSSSSQNKYEGFVFVGMVVQFVISLIIYCSSRKFNHYGFVSHPKTPGMCRRGWEWAPSIAWQALWNFVFGPFLLWQMRRMPRDIYNWRLQTTMAIVAGIPGTPVWLAGVYSNSLNSINTWFVPAAWFVPGLVVMQGVTLIFPIIAIRKHDKTSRELKQALADFDAKKKNVETSSTSTPSTFSKRSGKMHTMESLDGCLKLSYEGLQTYAAIVEFNCENIVFLVQVLKFKELWEVTFPTEVFGSSELYQRARKRMFCEALSIFITVVHTDTASYPINIDSYTYTDLRRIFSTATELVAKVSRRYSVSSMSGSVITPWDRPPQVVFPDLNDDAFPMHAMPSRTHSSINDSCEHIISLTEPTDLDDPLAGYQIPLNFDQYVFDAAFKSIRFMVWSGTYQRFMTYKNRSHRSAAQA